MFAWIAENISTIIISLIIAAICTAVIVKTVKDRKAGKATCSCGCSNCPMKGECHKVKR